MAHTRYGMAIDLRKCVGCGACALACKTENNTEFEQDGEKYNWADFLTFCHHRVQNRENPYCVDSCPSGARILGDLDDPQSEINHLLIANGYDRLANNSGEMLGGEAGTDPNVFYIGNFGAA